MVDWEPPLTAREDHVLPLGGSHQQRSLVPRGSTESQVEGRRERGVGPPRAGKGNKLPGACRPRTSAWAVDEDTTTVGRSAGKPTSEACVVQYWTKERRSRSKYFDPTTYPKNTVGADGGNW
jgi:hypothetical protein